MGSPPTPKAGSLGVVPRTHSLPMSQPCVPTPPPSPPVKKMMSLQAGACCRRARLAHLQVKPTGGTTKGVLYTMESCKQLCDAHNTCHFISSSAKFNDCFMCKGCKLETSLSSGLYQSVQIRPNTDVRYALFTYSPAVPHAFGGAAAGAGSGGLARSYASTSWAQRRISS